MADKKTQKKGTEGVMGDGSDLSFFGVDFVYSDNPNSFAINDPKQVAERLARKQRTRPRGGRDQT